MPLLGTQGWTGSKGRLRVIFDTNMQIAYSKENYKQMKLISDYAPFWRYVQIERNTKRDDHAKWHNKVFRHDDPIWSRIYPPSAFGCKCSVEALTEEEVKELGLDVDNGGDYETDKPDIEAVKAWTPDTRKYIKSISDALKRKVAEPRPAMVITNDKVTTAQATQDEIEDKVVALESRLSTLRNPALPTTPLGNRINNVWHLLPAFFKSKREIDRIVTLTKSAKSFEDLPFTIRDAVIRLERLKEKYSAKL
jgi:hypothetical protein